MPLIRNESKATAYPVASHPKVAEFLGREPDARELVRQFAARESNTDEFTIAGPPTFEELMRLRAEPDRVPPLPTVTIRMRRDKHHLTGVPVIRLIVSDVDLKELERWDTLRRAGRLAPRVALLGLPAGT